MIRLTLPLPPTVNHLYDGMGKNRRITDEYRAFKYEVLIACRLRRVHQIDGPLVLRVHVFTPDGDTSNRIKALEDALEDARAFANDFQIERLHVYRTITNKKTKPRAEVEIARLESDAEDARDTHAFLERTRE